METPRKRIAIVTSSTRGIGLACAERMARDGWKVWLAVRRLEAGRTVAARIGQAGGEADVVYFDADRRETYTSMIDRVIERDGRLDALVNNFGTTDVEADRDLLEGDTEAFFRIVDRNLQSVYLPSKAAVRAMIVGGGGSIVNISSVGGVIPDLSRTAYGTSKAAIDFLTQQIAVQYARQGVRCNAVLPGFTLTDAALDNMSKDFLQHYLEHVPIGRPGYVEDIAAAVAFLCSDDAAYITGQLLPVAGGFGLPTPLYASYLQKGSKG